MEKPVKAHITPPLKLWERMIVRPVDAAAALALGYMLLCGTLLMFENRIATAAADPAGDDEGP